MRHSEPVSQAHLKRHWLGKCIVKRIQCHSFRPLLPASQLTSLGLHQRETERRPQGAIMTPVDYSCTNPVHQFNIDLFVLLLFSLVLFDLQFETPRRTVPLASWRPVSRSEPVVAVVVW